MRAALLCALIASIYGALCLGPVHTVGLDEVVLQLRLPRVIAAVVAGSGLAVAGTGMQALLRNPLADPYILGLSSGASLGAVAVLVGGLALPVAIAASLGAMLTAALVFLIARDGQGLLPPVRLILAGVSVAAVLSSLTAFLIQIAPREASVRAALYFGAGAFGGSSTALSALAATIVVMVLTFGIAKSWALDRLLLGEETAESLGVDTRRLRMTLLVATTILTGVLVALAGPIGFVGLVAPHIARLLVGPGHRSVIPVAALLGALLVLWADTVGRTVFVPREIPAGLLTATVGGPFFLVLLNRRRYGFGGAV